MVRIEIYEKYISNEDEIEYLNEIGIDTSKQTVYGYRRTMPFLEEIDRPIEIPDNKDECIVRFWTGEEVIIKANYDEFCIFLHDVENMEDD